MSQLAHGEQRPQVKALGRKVLSAAGLAVDHAHHHGDLGFSRPQLTAGFDDLAAGGHDVLDHGNPASSNLVALREATGPVCLGSLADEHRRQAAHLGGDDCERHTAQLKSGKHIHLRRQQSNQRLGDLTQEDRV
jgi:hypothetical protein